MNYIIDIRNNKKYSIFSKNGKKLIKNYIKTLSKSIQVRGGAHQIRNTSTCPICFNDIPTGSRRYSVCAAGHQFCIPCVQTFTNYRITQCPTCRGPIHLQLLQNNAIGVYYITLFEMLRARFWYALQIIYYVGHTPFSTAILRDLTIHTQLIHFQPSYATSGIRHLVQLIIFSNIIIFFAQSGFIYLLGFFLFHAYICVINWSNGEPIRISEVLMFILYWCCIYDASHGNAFNTTWGREEVVDIVIDFVENSDEHDEHDVNIIDIITFIADILSWSSTGGSNNTGMESGRNLKQKITPKKIILKLKNIIKNQSKKKRYMNKKKK